jgi:hypothetical protein
MMTSPRPPAWWAVITVEGLRSFGLAVFSRGGWNTGVSWLWGLPDVMCHQQAATLVGGF